MSGERRRALITGISGQDGSFLAELLLEQGYEVQGLVHGERSLGCSEHLRERLTLYSGELLEPQSLRLAIERARPHELYHLASPSFVPASWEAPEHVLRTVAGSTATVLDAARALDDGTRVFVASSAMIFGRAGESPQREGTACRPTTPYGIAKLAGHQLVGAMRAHDELFACSGILFNHESERRPPQFVTRKITRAAAAIKLGLAQEVALGDLDAVRDWSFAGDVMRAAWLALQAERADDYVIASGVGRTVHDFARAAFAAVGLTADEHLAVSDELKRDHEPTPSVGDATRARVQLGWKARVSFDELVERMVHADLRELRTHPAAA
jgi:GDPmannose 4,6-dehydratase